MKQTKLYAIVVKSSGEVCFDVMRGPHIYTNKKYCQERFKELFLKDDYEIATFERTK